MNTESLPQRPHARQPAEVCEQLGVDPAHGLPVADIRTRRERHGPNRFAEAPRRRAWRILLDQFESVVIVVLVIAGAVAFAFRHWAEGIAITAVLLINGGLGFVTEWKAVRSMEALRKLGRATIRVRRDGQDTEVPVDDLVPGDLVVFAGGDLVPADIRLCEANTVRVNESALTGESVPVLKGIDPVDAETPLAERRSMLFRGTTVTQGSGLGVVTATGMATELGRISELAAGAREEVTPLQKRLDRLGRRLAWITGTVAVVVASVGLLAGKDPARMIETAIALGVAAIPEGLPIVATLALARGMVLMARRNALINRLPAVETLGATGVIFTDKTGTLTENHMTLRRVASPAGVFELDEQQMTVTRPDAGPDAATDTAAADHPLLRRILEVGVLCNNAALQDRDGDQRPEAEQGDPTETALLRAGLQAGFRREDLLAEKPEEREEPFDAETMMMATLHRDADGYLIAVKGAPSRVLDACTTLAADADDADPARGRELDDDERRAWSERAEAMAGDGLRVLAVADGRAAAADADPYRDLRLLGLVGLLDPPREDVRDAIAECHAAGVEVVMVTGDQPATAAAIARQVGILDDDREASREDGAPAVVHGRELTAPEELPVADRERLLGARVFARVSPEQKLNLISLEQASGRTVAMTGDGVNDAPALKKADIGVAMGQRGTDAARQVSDMILQDDAFATIVAAVRQGRIIFDNIRKSVMFMLCTNVAEVLVVAVAAGLGGLLELPLPLRPLQILYLNVITDVFPAIALGVGRGEPDIMRRPPRPHDEPVLTRGHWRAVGGWATLLGACVLGSLIIALHGLGLDEQRAVTVSFLTLAFGKLWFVYNLRAPGTSLLRNDIVRNPWVAGAILLCIVLLLAAVYVAPLSAVLKTSPPGGAGWLLLLGMSLVPLLVGQAWREFQRHHHGGAAFRS